MSEATGTGAKLGRILLWLATIAFGLAMLGAGATKFTSAATWTELFVGWGYPAWLSYVVGSFEVAGALAFLVPRYATYAASVIVVIMAAAAVTVITHPGEMGPVVPIVNIVAFGLVGVLRRDVRWTPS